MAAVSFFRTSYANISRRRRRSIARRARSRYSKQWLPTLEASLRAVVSALTIFVVRASDALPPACKKVAANARKRLSGKNYTVMVLRHGVAAKIHARDGTNPISLTDRKFVCAFEGRDGDASAVLRLAS